MKKATAKKSNGTVQATSAVRKTANATTKAKASAKTMGTEAGQQRMLQAELAALLQNEAVAEFRADGTLLTANPQFLRVFGYSPEEIKGQHHRFFVDDKTSHSGEYFDLWARLSRGESQTGEYKLTGKNGREIWAHATYSPVADHNGNVVKVIGRVADATQEINARQAAIRIKTAVDKVSTAIMMVDRDFIVNYVNETTMKMLTKNAEHFRALWPSFSTDKIVGTCIDIFHRNPAHQRGLLADPRNLPHSADIKVGPLQFSLCVNGIFDPQGNYVGNILEWADVTESRKQESTSRDLGAQMAAIGRAQAVIEFKLDGTIVTANENFTQTVGYSLDEIKGKHHSIFVAPDKRNTPAYQEFWAKLNRGEDQFGQFSRVRKDGQEIWLQASYNPIPDMTGKICKVVKYASDITAYKQQEQQMARALSETSRVMTAVAAGDLSESMEGTFEGEFARLRDCINGSVGSLSKMMAEARRVMSAVAAGDLRESMQGAFDGDYAKLRDSVNSCVEHLRKTVEQIRHAMSTMTVSATEIATGNLDLSQRTEEQAASLATTAANMEEITGTVKRTADNAKEAKGLATGARQHAEKGGAVVANAINAMGAINEASKRIADIIGVIDEIAFQTNLLALNAAVEAARAGEQGRGFAVVASEVRNLAQRSAGAAKEIKSLIKDSVGRVEEGSRLVNESGSTLEGIVMAAKKVSDIVAEIAAASQEQSQGIEKVSEAVQQMDVAVQQNSALVEQTAAASNMMDDQTRSMSALVDFFKLSDHDGDFAAIPKKGSPLVKARTFKAPVAAAKRPVESSATAHKHRTPDEALMEEF